MHVYVPYATASSVPFQGKCTPSPLSERRAWEHGIGWAHAGSRWKRPFGFPILRAVEKAVWISYPPLLQHISPIGWDNVILYGEYALDPGWVRHPHGLPQYRVEHFA
jgi:hypothetical protein